MVVSTITQNIEVSVETSFLDDQSDPDEHYFVWAYRITLTNHGDDTVQLMTRHWLISDAQGRAQEVRGDGVVGEQPIIAPGTSYSYASGCPLQTPSGFMRGSYQMRDQNDRQFDVEIPGFSLDSPHQVRDLH